MRGGKGWRERRGHWKGRYTAKRRIRTITRTSSQVVRVQLPRGAPALVFFFGLLFTLVLVTSNGLAQTTPVCSNTPGSGERIECKKDATSTDDIEIQTENVIIRIITSNADAIYAEHLGNGTNTIRVRGSTLTALVDYAGGITNAQYGTVGNSNTYIIDSTITTAGDNGFGIFNIIQESSLVGNILLDAEDLRITTAGVDELRDYGFGLFARNQADEGDIRVEARKYTYNGTGHGILWVEGRERPRHRHDRRQ